jgi:hypothetical protein
VLEADTSDRAVVRTEVRHFERSVSIGQIDKRDAGPRESLGHLQRGRAGDDPVAPPTSQPIRGICGQFSLLQEDRPAPVGSDESIDALQDSPTINAGSLND